MEKYVHGKGEGHFSPLPNNCPYISLVHHNLGIPFTVIITVHMILKINLSLPVKNKLPGMQISSGLKFTVYFLHSAKQYITNLKYQFKHHI